MRKLLLIAALALGTAAWAQTAGMNPAESQRTNHDFDQQQSMPSGQDQQFKGSEQRKDDWYQSHLNLYVDQFARVNNHVSPTIAGIVDQQDQFNGARPGAMASNASESTQPGQQAMAANAGEREGTLKQGEDYWYNRKVQADAELNRRALAAIKSNPDRNSADLE